MNLLDHRTGAIVDGFHGIVDAAEDDLPGIAEQVMERTGGSWRNCRVAFFAGRRGQDEVMRDDDVYGIVAQGDPQFVPGPAHPAFAPSAKPTTGSQPRPVSSEPWKGHGLADGQVVECGACRSEVTVRLERPGAFLIGTLDNVRGTALICGCGRLLCADCVMPVGGMNLGLPSCDRCGGTVGPLAEDDGA